MKYYVCDSCGMKQEVKLGESILRDYDWDIELLDIDGNVCTPDREGLYHGAVKEIHICPYCAMNKMEVIK